MYLLPLYYKLRVFILSYCVTSIQILVILYWACSINKYVTGEKVQFRYDQEDSEHGASADDVFAQLYDSLPSVC